MDNTTVMTYEYFMSEYGYWREASDGYPVNPGWYWFASIITDAEGKKQFDIYSNKIYVGADSDELYLKDNFLRPQTLDQFMKLNNVSYWAYAFIPHAAGILLTKEGDIFAQ